MPQCSLLAGSPEDLVEISTHDRKGQPLRTVFDTRTGIVRNEPIPSDAELEKFYALDYRVRYKGSAEPRKRQILRNSRLARDFFAANAETLRSVQTVLDVGAGSGEYVFAANYLDKKAAGLEPNIRYAHYCRDELQLDVTTGFVERSRYPSGMFDLIILSHVLEHLNDPVGCLSILRDWLAPGGVVFVAVPNIDEMCRHHSKGNMFHYGHIWNFSPSTLRIACGLAGLQERNSSKQIQGSSTEGFFEECDPRPAPASNFSAAERTYDLISRHNRGEFSKSNFAKPFKKLAHYIEEEFTSRKFSSPIEILGAVMAGQVK